MSKPAIKKTQDITNDITGGVKKITDVWKRWFFVLAAVFFILIIVIVGIIFVYQEVNAHKIYPGVHLGKINFGGYTLNEARDLLSQLTNEFNQKGLLFLADTGEKHKEMRITPILVAPADPDLTLEIIKFDLEATLAAAWQVGRAGTWLKRVEAELSLLFLPERLPLRYYINRGEVERIIIQNFSELEQPGNDARLEIEEHQARVVPEKYGNSFDYNQSLLDLEDRLLTFDFERPVKLTLKIDYPKIKAGDTMLAVAKAEQVLEKFKDTPLVLKYKDKKWMITQKSLEDWLVFTLKSESEVAIGLDQASTTAFLEELAKEIDLEAKEALFAMATSSGEELRVEKFQASEDGLKLDKEASYEKILSEMVRGDTNEVELVTAIVKPRQTIERVNNLGIKELIGVGESNFAGSPKNRRHNIGVGAKKLNGLLIAPDEEFSLVSALGEVNAVAGYLPELVIKGNETIPEYGGGLCQIGTTTFRAALYSGLLITERSPHSYRVSYYEPAGMDATIYNPRPDLKFINDTGHYILFATEVNGDTLRFKFYGTNDGRKIEVESPPRLWNIIHPAPTKLIETLDLEPGEKKCTEKAHNGADAEFTRTVSYFDDSEPLEEKWFSRYRPWQAVCLIGVETLSTTTSAEEVAD